MTFEYVLSTPINNTPASSSIILNLTYSLFSENNTYEYPTYQKIGKQNQPPDTVIEYLSKHLITFEFPAILIDLIYKQNLFGTGFGFTIGPLFTIFIKKEFNHSYEIFKPEDKTFYDFDYWDKYVIRYENKGRKIVFREGDFSNMSTFGYGYKFGLHYEFALHKALIMPYFRIYNIDVIFKEDDIWKMTGFDIGGFQFGFDVKF